jgi:hypothetical protein
MSLINNAKFYIQPENGGLYSLIVIGKELSVYDGSSNLVGNFNINAVYVEFGYLKINSNNAYFEFNVVNLDTINGTAFTSVLDSLAIINNEILGSGNLTISSVEITRPANTTAYIAKDVVGTIMTFSNALKSNAGNGYITKVRLMGDVSTQTFKAKLHLYSISPSAVVDNDPFTLLYANTTNRLGAIELQALSTEGTGSTACSTIWTAGKADVNGFAQGILPIKGATGSNIIYGILETLDAFTPTSGGKYFVELTVDNI